MAATAITAAINGAGVIGNVADNLFRGDAGNALIEALGGDAANRTRLAELIKQAGGRPQNLIGRKAYFTGASGLGNFECTITGVDLNKCWIEVKWADGTAGLHWKTARLCNSMK